MYGRRSQCGSILAIGGHEKRTGRMQILAHFVSLCGGTDARLIVLTTASPTPGRKETEYGSAFRALGAAEVSFYHQYHRSECDDPHLLSELRDASGVFLAGGHQSRLVNIIAGTALELRLHELHRTGLHLAGTSAGAAALGTLMIARGRSHSSVHTKLLSVTPGLAFLANTIVDQHFRERDRIGRLLNTIASNPSMTGFGLDEDTAFELDAHDRAQVIGSGTLTIVDGSKLEASEPGGPTEPVPPAFTGMRVHVLRDGWIYDAAGRHFSTPSPATTLDSSAASNLNQT